MCLCNFFLSTKLQQRAVTLSFCHVFNNWWRWVRSKSGLFYTVMANAIIGKCVLTLSPTLLTCALDQHHFFRSRLTLNMPKKPKTKQLRQPLATEQHCVMSTTAASLIVRIRSLETPRTLLVYLSIYLFSSDVVNAFLKKRLSRIKCANQLQAEHGETPRLLAYVCLLCFIAAENAGTFQGRQGLVPSPI